MYLSQTQTQTQTQMPRPIDFYKEPQEEEEKEDDLVMDLTSTGDLPHHHNHQNQQQMILAGSSGDDHELRAPKKRAETWVQDETRCLIGFRRQVDALFNTSKSNKRLWEQISDKMREKGFDRSPTMCTDKWRNLLKEFKKVKLQDRGNNNGSGSSANKMWYYKELAELLRDRAKNGSYKSPPRPTYSKVDDAYIHFSDKGLEDSSVTFGSVEANGPSTVNLETPLDNDADPLAITVADAVAANGVPHWNWRESPGSGGEGHPSYCGRVITVKWGEYRRRIGIDGSPDAIKEAIKSAFRLRTRRAFWLEDEDCIIRSIGRDMPLGNYTLHLDEGISFKVCVYGESDQLAVHTEDKTLYTEDDFRDFLTRRGLIGLREMNSYRCFSNIDDLRPGAVYQGVRLLGE